MGMKREFKSYFVARTKSLLTFVFHEMLRTKTSAKACALTHVRDNLLPLVFVFIIGVGG